MTINIDYIKPEIDYIKAIYKSAQIGDRVYKNGDYRITQSFIEAVKLRYDFYPSNYDNVEFSDGTILPISDFR